MGVLLQRWQDGFALGDQFYKNVFANKLLWAIALLAVAVDAMKFVFLMLGFFPIGNVISFSFFVSWLVFIVFSVLYYFIGLILFFCAERLMDKKAIVWRDAVVKSFNLLKTPIVWFFIFIPLYGIVMGFLSACIIPIIVLYKGNIKDSLYDLWILLKRFFIQILGFGFYMGIILIFVGLFLFFLGMVLRFANVRSWVEMGVFVERIILFGLSAFFRAMWSFLQVHIYNNR